MRKVLTLLVALAIALMLASCGDSKSSFGETGVKVTGEFGDKPKITHREGKPSKKLLDEVLVKGDGDVVKKADILSASYQGQIWTGNKVFDNSYDRGTPTSFPIGVGGVITGWDETLVGKKVGDRVLLSIPSDKGYKETGNPQAGIKGTDTLLFVVDIIAADGNDDELDAKVVSPAPAGGVSVTGGLDGEPVVKVAKGTKPLTKNVVFAEGKGKPVADSQKLITRFVIYDYTGKKLASSWAPLEGKPATPSADLSVGPGAQGEAGAVDAIKGVKVGSRVLMPLPPQKDPKTGAVQNAFAVIDIMRAFDSDK